VLALLAVYFKGRGAQPKTNGDSGQAVVVAGD